MDEEQVPSNGSDPATPGSVASPDDEHEMVERVVGYLVEHAGNVVIRIDAAEELGLTRQQVADAVSIAIDTNVCGAAEYVQVLSADKAWLWTDENHPAPPMLREPWIVTRVEGTEDVVEDENGARYKLVRVD